jgi:predicted amidohydrolase YtcJ
MLRAGMLGDVTIFDRDLFAMDPEDFNDAAVDLTVIDGVVVYRREG